MLYAVSGVHASVPRGYSSPGGMTPTISSERPLVASVTCLPMTPESPAKCCCQAL